MRFILFTGKGGVGKTTIASSTAISIAKNGLKTLLISTDPAHSLSDALSIKLSPEPEEVANNLWCMEFDVYYSMKKYWSNMKDLMYSVFKFQGVKNVVADELSVLPGMEEGAAFLWLEKFYEEQFFDVVVIDSAPTGETLTLLSLPQSINSWLTKAFPGQKIALNTLGKVVRKTTGIPLDKGYGELQHIFSKLETIQQLFLDRSITSMRVVCNPEKMVIQEAKRAISYLQLYGYNVDALIVNRIIPSDTKGFLSKYEEQQKVYLKQIFEEFKPLPIFKSNHFGEEVFGMKKLEKLATSLYGEFNPEEVLLKEDLLEVESIDKGYQIKMKIPHLDASAISLEKFGDELVININNQRRNYFLPKFAHFLEMDSYEYISPWLYIKLLKN